MLCVCGSVYMGIQCYQWFFILYVLNFGLQACIVSDFYPLRSMPPACQQRFNIKLLIKYFSLQDESSSTTNLCVEDLQKNKDSNSIIKDRLSQTVRQNSKSFFDPVRKCNGQPVPFQQPKHFTGGVMRWYQVEGMEWLRVMNYFLFLKKLYYYCVYVWVGVRTTTHVDIRK